MGDGLPKVIDRLRARGKTIDAAVDSAVKPTSTTTESPVKVEKPITADEAAAKSAKYKADREAFEAETKKGMPKPSLLGRLLGR